MRRQPPEDHPAVEALRVLVRAFQTLPCDPDLRRELLHNPAAVIVWGLASTEQHEAWEHWLQQGPGVVDRIVQLPKAPDRGFAEWRAGFPDRQAEFLVDRLARGKPLRGPGLVLSPWRVQPPRHVRRRLEALETWRSTTEGEELLTEWLDHLGAAGDASRAIRAWLATSPYLRMLDLYPLYLGD